MNLVSNLEVPKTPKSQKAFIYDVMSYLRGTHALICVLSSYRLNRAGFKLRQPRWNWSLPFDSTFYNKNPINVGVFWRINRKCHFIAANQHTAGQIVVYYKSSGKCMAHVGVFGRSNLVCYESIVVHAFHRPQSHSIDRLNSIQ